MADAKTTGGRNEKIVRLAVSRADDPEVTLYLKGFLGRNDDPERYGPWLASHRQIVTDLGWGPRAYGYAWSAGTFDGLPIPKAATVAAAWRLYQAGRRARRVAAIGAVGMIAAEEVVQIVAHFIGQYRAAVVAAEERADALAEKLVAMQRRYGRVRVVAHSLGCRHLIEAIALLTPTERPHEVHLCAPACLEADVQAKLDFLARDKAFLYHTRADAVLEVGFRIMARGRALGAVGPRGEYEGLEAINVGQHFGLSVHRDYKNRLPRFVRGPENT